MGHCIKHRPTYYLVCLMICFIAATVPAFYGLTADKSYGHYLINDYNVSDTTHHYYLSLNRVDVSIFRQDTINNTDSVQIESCSYSFIKLNGNCGNVTGINNVSALTNTSHFVVFLLIVIGVLPILYFVAQIAFAIYHKHHESELSEKLFRHSKLSMLLVLISSVGCFAFAQYRYNTILSYITNLNNVHSILFLINISHMVCTCLGTAFLILSYLALLCCNGHHHHHHHHHHDGYHSVQTHE
ncbi:hypothetical protein ACTFIW_007436 [Dictyostelium discoideum]